MRAPSSRTTRLLLVAILLLSVLTQATVVSRTQVLQPLRVDALDYFSYAFNLRQHGVYSLDRTWITDRSHVPAPDAVRPPGYPLFLAAFNPDADWGWLRRLGYLQSILAVLSVALVYALGRRFLDPGWALFAALLTALCPSLVVMSTYVLSETLFAFLLLAATLATLHALRRPELAGPALLSGVAWGLTALVRPTSQFLPFCFLLLALALPTLRPLRRAAAIGVLGFALAMAPWLLRNQSLPSVPDGRSLMVKALAHGSYPDFKYEDRQESLGYPYRSDPEGAERSRDLRSVLGYIARDFRVHPLRMARWYLVGKPVAFLSWADPQSTDIFIYEVRTSPYFDSEPLNRSWQFMYWSHPVFAALAVLAMLFALWKPGRFADNAEARAAAVVVAFVFAYAIAFHMLVAPFPRYNVPFRPLMFLLAALALQVAWKRRPWAAASVPVGVAHG